jgi:UDPglucose 6-dehydrogenase
VGAACLAEWGCDVVGADPDAAAVAKLQGGHAPIFEPGLDALVQQGLAAGRLRFTGDLAAAVRDRAYVLLMFDTPVDENDRVDLRGIFSAVEMIAPHLAPDVVLHVTAQVPVGTCDRIVETVRRVNPALKFGLSYSPENLRLGEAIERFRRPPLPVIGSDDGRTLDRVEALLRPAGVRWERVNLRTAEMSKHALNAFLATSICFANELGNLCDEVGADGARLAQVLRLEPRIGPKAMLFPGLGFSGGTLARDLQALRALGDRSELDTALLDGAWESNRRQNGLVVRRLRRALGALQGVRACVLGLTYKPDTSTLRRSAALEIIAAMAAEGMQITAHDPKADRGELSAQRGFAFRESVEEAVNGAQVLVVVTPWREYRDLDLGALARRMSPPRVLFDASNLFQGEAARAAGFLYLDIGRGRGGGRASG